MKYAIEISNDRARLAKIEDGRPFLIKTDSLKDSMPLCVGFNRKGALQVGDQALNKYKSEKLRAGMV